MELASGREPLVDFTNLDWWIERGTLIKRIVWGLYVLICAFPVGFEIWIRRFDIRYSLFSFGRSDADYFDLLNHHHGPWYGPGPHDSFIEAILACFIVAALTSVVCFFRIFGSTRRPGGVGRAVRVWLLSLGPFLAMTATYIQCAPLID